MATRTVQKTTPEVGQAEPTALDADRKRVALEAVWEIEVLTALLLEQAASEAWALESEQAMVLRGLGVRIKALSCVAMSALDDPIVSTSCLNKTVFGYA